MEPGCMFRKPNITKCESCGFVAQHYPGGVWCQNFYSGGNNNQILKTAALTNHYHYILKEHVVLLKELGVPYVV